MLKKLLLACAAALACGATTSASALMKDPYELEFLETACQRYGGGFCEQEWAGQVKTPQPPPPPPPQPKS